MKRYSKQIKLPGFGIEKQQKLTGGSVLIIGAGGLGCPAILYLAAAGIGKLGIMDDDKVDITNLHRQPIYNTQDVGQLKAILASEKAKAINPDIEVIPITERLSIENAIEIISQYDWIMDCTDNFPTRYLINDACVLTNKPWIFGAIEGWAGQVAVFNMNYKGIFGPTYRCLFPEPPSAEEAPDCNDLGVIGSLPAVIGSLMANELIKCISGAGKPLSGEVMAIDLAENRNKSFKLSRNDKAIKAITQLRETYSLESECIIPDDNDAIEMEVSSYLNNAEQYTLIDIREEFEYEQENMGGQNIPYHTLLADSSILAPQTQYVLLCERGKRSKILAENMRQKKGLYNIKSLSGGIIALMEGR